eukprot:2496210-Heterocapsa_arctica.AAC.1
MNKSPGGLNHFKSSSKVSSSQIGYKMFQFINSTNSKVGRMTCTPACMRGSGRAGWRAGNYRLARQTYRGHGAQRGAEGGQRRLPAVPGLVWKNNEISAWKNNEISAWKIASLRYPH